MSKFAAEPAEIRLAILNLMAPLAVRIHGDHAQQPRRGDWQGVSAEHLLALYPYSVEKALTYLAEGLQPKPRRWPGFGRDTRQERFEQLIRTAKAPGSLLSTHYGWDGGIYESHKLGAYTFAELLDQQGLSLDNISLYPLFSTLDGLADAVTDAPPIDNHLNSFVLLERVLPEFVTAFNRF